MDRSIESDDRQPDLTGVREGPLAQSRSQTSREKPKEKPLTRGLDKPERHYEVSDAQRQTMADIGRFRAPSMDDIAQSRYDGDRDKMRQDLGPLLSQDLVKTKTVWTGKKKEPLVVVALTNGLEKKGSSIRGS